jgi:putative Holliday junction resolvase
VRLLAIDYGKKWFGLAVSDPSQTLARSLKRVRGEEELLRTVSDLAAAGDLEAVVLGLPRNMDGSLGPAAQSVLAFQARLEARCGLPVVTWDERLTSVEAERRLAEGGQSLSRRREKVDSLAAQILLQSYLDARAAERSRA